MFSVKFFRYTDSSPGIAPFVEQQAADMNKMVAIGHGHGGGMVAGRDSRHRKKIKLG